MRKPKKAATCNLQSIEKHLPAQNHLPARSAVITRNPSAARRAAELLIGSPFRVSLEEGHSAVVYHVPTRLNEGSLVLIPNVCRSRWV